MGGYPSKGTPKDKRLKENRPAQKPQPAPAKPATMPARKAGK